MLVSLPVRSVGSNLYGRFVVGIEEYIKNNVNK